MTEHCPQRLSSRDAEIGLVISPMEIEARRRTEYLRRRLDKSYEADPLYVYLNDDEFLYRLSQKARFVGVAIDAIIDQVEDPEIGESLHAAQSEFDDLRSMIEEVRDRYHYGEFYKDDDAASRDDKGSATMEAAE